MTICVWHYVWAIIGMCIGFFVLVPTLIFIKSKLLKTFDPDLLNTPQFATETQWLPLFPMRRASLYAFFVASTRIAKRFANGYDFKSRLDPKMIWICRAYLACCALILFNIFVLYPMMMPFCGTGFLPNAYSLNDSPRGPAQWEEISSNAPAPVIPPPIAPVAPAAVEPPKAEVPKTAKKKNKKKPQKSAQVETPQEVSQP